MHGNGTWNWFVVRSSCIGIRENVVRSSLFLWLNVPLFVVFPVIRVDDSFASVLIGKSVCWKVLEGLDFGL